MNAQQHPTVFGFQEVQAELTACLESDRPRTPVAAGVPSPASPRFSRSNTGGLQRARSILSEQLATASASPSACTSNTEQEGEDWPSDSEYDEACSDDESQPSPASSRPVSTNTSSPITIFTSPALLEERKQRHLQQLFQQAMRLQATRTAARSGDSAV